MSVYVVMLFAVTAVALVGALRPARQIPAPKFENAITCSGNTLRPDWDLHELYIDAVGHLRWKGWSAIDRKRRDSALWGIPLKGLTTGRKKTRRSFNEEVKVLAWSITEFDHGDNDSIAAGPQFLPRVLLWVRYTLDSSGSRERWALMDLWRGAHHDSVVLGTRWRARWQMPCGDPVNTAGDSVRRSAVRSFERRPTNADIYRFIDERACIYPALGKRSDFFTIAATLSPGMRLVRLDTAICADMWKDLVGEGPERHFVVR